MPNAAFRISASVGSLLLGLGLTGCSEVPADSATAADQDALSTENGLTSINGLATSNGLASFNGLMTTAPGRSTVSYLVKCALPAGHQITKQDQYGTSYTFAGS